VRTVPQSDNPNEKWCPVHKAFFDRSKFGKDKYQPSGLTYRCRQCHNKAHRVYKQRYRRRHRIPVKKHKHGMEGTPEYKSCSEALTTTCGVCSALSLPCLPVGRWRASCSGYSSFSPSSYPEAASSCSVPVSGSVGALSGVYMVS